MSETAFFQNFKLNSPNKYILYVSGLIFLLSFFFPVQGADVSIVRRGSLIFIIVGLGNWILKGIQGFRLSILEARVEDAEEMPDNIKTEIIFLVIGEYLILILSYSIAWTYI